MNKQNALKTTVISILLLLFSASSVLAKKQIEIQGDTAFKNQEIISGAVKVVVSYKPFNPEASDSSEPDNLSYKIFYQGKAKVEDRQFTSMTGNISLEDLDANKIPEVIVTTYSGGAHCCTNFIIYTWQGNQFVKAETGFLNAGGGEFQDLNGDDRLEFITVDNSFFYTFSSYAGSFPPTLIYALKQGKLENVTRQYPQKLRKTLREMYQVFEQNKKEKYEINGILAGYVAQKILLGEYQQGWKLMLANYDRHSDWGLEIYQGDNVIGKYPDFPTALKAFLIKTGYLDKNGQPLISSPVACSLIILDFGLNAITHYPLPL